MFPLPFSSERGTRSLCSGGWMCSAILMALLWSCVQSEDSDILTIAADTCRYEIHTSALSWEKAVQACRQRGLTLASLSNQIEATSIYSALKRAESVYSKYNDQIDDETYWVGLRMDWSQGGTSSFQWGNCVSDPSAPHEFPDILGFSGSSGCGFLSQEALKMSTCFATQSMGFICENPAGSDACFTTLSSTTHPLGYDSQISRTSSLCASSCLMEPSCAGVFLDSGASCSLLTYSQDLSSSLGASDLQSAHYYHKKFFYRGAYSSFRLGLSVEDLCNLPIVGLTTPPIVTSSISDLTTSEFISPTPSSTTNMFSIEDITTQNTTTDDTTTSHTTPDDTTTQHTTPDNTTTQHTTPDDTTTQQTTPDDTTTQQTTPDDTTTQQTTPDDTTTQHTTPDNTTTQHTTPDDTTTQQTTPDDTTTQHTTPDDTTTQHTTPDDTTTQHTTPDDTTTEDITSIATSVDTTVRDTTTATPNVETTTEHPYDAQTEVTPTVTEMTTSAEETGVTVYNFSTCVCVCKETNETVQEKITRMVADLKVDTSTLSSSTRQKISVEDPRRSAAMLGALGVAVICLWGCLVLGFDLLRFLQYIGEKRKQQKVSIELDST